jgi:hypothetical protein
MTIPTWPTPGAPRRQQHAVVSTTSLRRTSVRRVQLIGEIQRVGIDPLRGQQLRPDMMISARASAITLCAILRCRRPRGTANCWSREPAI